MPGHRRLPRQHPRIALIAPFCTGTVAGTYRVGRTWEPLPMMPHGRRKPTTFVGALGMTGMTAPMVLDRAMDAPAFEAYVKEALAPTLKPGDIVMDNLPAHMR